MFYFYFFMRMKMEILGMSEETIILTGHQLNSDMISNSLPANMSSWRIVLNLVTAIGTT